MSYELSADLAPPSAYLNNVAAYGRIPMKLIAHDS